MFLMFPTSYAQEEEETVKVKVVKVVKEEVEPEEKVNDDFEEENAQTDECGRTVEDMSKKRAEDVWCFNPTSERCGDFVEHSKIGSWQSKTFMTNRCTSILKSEFHDKWTKLGDE